MSPRHRDPFFLSTALRGRFLLVGWVGALGFLLFRAGEVQLGDAAAWRAEAERQHRSQGALPAPRGSILDRNGILLAANQERFRVAVAPRELRDREAAADTLAAVLGISRAQALEVTRSDRPWRTFPGVYPPRAREALDGIQGIHLERELRRSNPYEGLALGTLGRTLDGVGAGGIEQAYEAHLKGIPGSRIVSRDSGGRPIPGESWIVQEPRAGGDVVLTLDRDLQAIATEALEAAIVETGARGGDLLVTDPRTGEILAMVSIRDGARDQLGVINTPYEPGSTLKPFTVASLLQLGKASLADSVDTGDGRWVVAGRTISDVSRVGKVTLAHALRVSSNVAIAKVAESLSPAEQYEGLRDFGFGMQSGIELPGEATGMLRHPRNWSRQSAASLSMWYEMSVTPLQMALAYGALANGGLLMEPRIVREVRGPDGRVLERFEPRVVRRVIRPDVAAELSRTLVEAVEEGTGTRARLSTFSVAGKSGTARATGPDGRYETGAYFASFVGFFPAESPQLVVFVKLERPQGAYYGGATAAPVTRATMEAVLAARHPPLDREALATIARSQERELRATGEGDHTAGEAPVPAPRPGGGIPALFASFENGTQALPTGGVLRPGTDEEPGEAGPGRFLLPQVSGLPARSALRTLHGLGLHVVWEGEGPVAGTLPRAGAEVSAGDTVRVRGARGGPAAGRDVR
jgi:cell division protein FtsI (penicillin-binding protein 3)